MFSLNKDIRLTRVAKPLTRGVQDWASNSTNIDTPLYLCFALRSLNYLDPMYVRMDASPHTKPLHLTQLRAL